LARNVGGTSGGSNQRRQQRKPGSTTRKPMLNIGQKIYFRNDLKEIVLNSEMDDNIKASFMATLTARAEKMSIPDAKIYLKEVQDRGQIAPPTAMRVLRLLDRYTKYR